jgi:hypothetical protein
LLELFVKQRIAVPLALELIRDRLLLFGKLAALKGQLNQAKRSTGHRNQER